MWCMVVGSDNCGWCLCGVFDCWGRCWGVCRVDEGDDELLVVVIVDGW